MPKSKAAPKIKRVVPVEDIQDNVVTKSNRVCAFCWAFERDGRSKRQGQLAHIDRDSSNSREANLAWLCLSCHDTYDSIPRQTKKLREAELAAHKATVERLVAAGNLPTRESSGAALLTVDVEFTLLKLTSGKSVLFEVWCAFSNEGERRTGIKRTYVSRSGQQVGELGFPGGIDEDRRPGDQDAWHPDAEYLFLMRDQVVEPGECRRWAVTFSLKKDSIPEIDFSRIDEAVEFEPPLEVVFEPVLGSAILLTLSSARVNPRGVYPRTR